MSIASFQASSFGLPGNAYRRLLWWRSSDGCNCLHSAVAGGRWSRSTAAGYAIAALRYLDWCDAFGVESELQVTAKMVRYTISRCPQRRRHPVRRTLSQGQWTRFLGRVSDDSSNRCAATGGQRATLYTLVAWTGMRASEARLIRSDDFNRQAGGGATVCIPSCKSPAAWRPIPPWLFADVARDFVFLHHDGGPILARALGCKPSRLIARDLRLAGLPTATPEGKFDFHSLRAQCARNMQDAGICRSLIRAWMRHRTDRVLDRYLEPSADDVQAAYHQMLSGPAPSYSPGRSGLSIA